MIDSGFSWKFVTGLTCLEMLISSLNHCFWKSDGSFYGGGGVD